MRIAVLAGGRTPERDVSLRGGHRVAGALGELGHDVTLLDPGEVQLVEALFDAKPDICYLTLHGKDGEDGTVQRLLDLLDIPYTGTTALDCEAVFDKRLTKEVLGRVGVRTPRWATIEGQALRDLGAGAALDRTLDKVGLPCVVKPSRSGSSLGVGFVREAGDLAPAVMAALAYSDAAVIEQQIDGVEVAASLIGSPLEALPLVEIEPKEGRYDYAARYTAGATEYFTPARVDDAAAAICAETSLRAVQELGVRDVARVDVIIDSAGQAWVLEVNVAPGMTETSLLPMAAKAVGMSLADLCDTILQSSLARYEGGPA